ncbi:MAG: alkaline shock response membrane anchor protein AmaP [Fusobacteriaceae bacterium]
MKKFIFFLAWVGILFLALTGIIYVIYPDYILQFSLSSFMLKAIILNISLIYLCIVFMKLMSNFKKNRDYEIKTADGKVAISESAIASMTREAVSYDHDIFVKKIISSNSRGKFRLSLHLESSSDINLSEKTSRLQSVIRSYFQSKAGIELDSIELKVVKLLDKHS